MRELQVRWTQTLLGPLWLVLQPLPTAAVFTLFLHRLARVPGDGAPYALFAWAGLVPWLFFANGVQALSWGLVMNGPLLTRVYVPRLLVPLSMTAVRLVDLAVSAAVLTALVLLAGLVPTPRLLAVPAFALTAALLTAAVGAACSVLVARFRDFGTLLPVALQVLMFVSPVMYPASLVPPEWRPAYDLNPLAPLIEGFRAAFLGRPFDVRALAVATLVSCALSLALFRFYVRAHERALDVL